MSLKTISDRELFWYVVIHIVFVFSSVLLALSDRIAAHGGKDESHGTAEPKPNDLPTIKAASPNKH